MLEAIPLFIVLYLLAGIAIAEAVDAKQMKEHVPYAEFPSLFRLAQIRAVVFFFMLAFGPLVFVEAFLRRLAEHLLRRAVKG